MGTPTTYISFHGIDRIAAIDIASVSPSFTFSGLNGVQVTLFFHDDAKDYVLRLVNAINTVAPAEQASLPFDEEHAAAHDAVHNAYAYKGSCR